MAKKQVAVSLRKPPPPADLAALVVEGVQSSFPEAGPISDVRELRAEAPKADAFVATRPIDLPGKRSITVQLPEATVERLLAFCRLHERDVNDVVAEILARHLAVQTPSQEGVSSDGLSLDALMQWMGAQLTVLASHALAFRARVVQLAGL
ncbi:MAG: hypothetical protein ABI175_04995 [Polyangiales bacterium]